MGSILSTERTEGRSVRPAPVGRSDRHAPKPSARYEARRTGGGGGRPGDRPRPYRSDNVAAAGLDSARPDHVANRRGERAGHRSEDLANRGGERAGHRSEDLAHELRGMVWSNGTRRFRELARSLK